MTGYQGKHGKKQKTLPISYIVMGVLFVIGLIVGVLWALYSISAPAEIYEDANIQYVGDIPIIENILPEGAAGRPGGERVIEYIVIHETDNYDPGANALAHGKFLLNYGKTNEHSWHYTVDESQIVQHIPDDEPAYHAGDHMKEHGGNLNGIGIEICVAEDNDFTKSVENAALLTAYLLDAYHLTPENVEPHKCFSGKECPAQLLQGGRWDNFIDLVTKDYENLIDKNTEEN